MTVEEFEEMGYVFTIHGSGYCVTFNAFFIEDQELNTAYHRRIMATYSYGPRGQIIQTKPVYPFNHGTVVIAQGKVKHGYDKKHKPWDKPMSQSQMLKICLNAAAKHFALWRLSL